MTTEKDYISAAYGTGALAGPSGCALFVIAAVVALACGLCSAPPLEIAKNVTEADKARAQAQEKQADALRVEAEADKRIAEAEAKMLEDYSEVASAAINADRRRAHPEELLVSSLKYISLCCLSLLLLPLILVAFWAISRPQSFKDFFQHALKGTSE